MPNRPDQNNAFYANANHSSIFLQLVGKSEKLGTYKIYLLTDFTGNGKTGYGLRLKQAYATLGPVTAGLANSTFMDASVGTPGIDDRDRQARYSYATCSCVSTPISATIGRPQSQSRIQT